LKKDASASFFFGRIAFLWVHIRNATEDRRYRTPIRVLSLLLHKTDQLFTDSFLVELPSLRFDDSCSIK